MTVLKNSLRPNGDKQHDLGRDGIRWNKLWVGDINADGVGGFANLLTDELTITSPTTDNTFTFLINENDLIILDKDNNEISLGLSGNGATGPTGQIGVTGPTGIDGATGATGPAGIGNEIIINEEYYGFDNMKLLFPWLPNDFFTSTDNFYNTLFTSFSNALETEYPDYQTTWEDFYTGYNLTNSELQVISYNIPIITLFFTALRYGCNDNIFKKYDPVNLTFDVNPEQTFEEAWRIYINSYLQNTDALQIYSDITETYDPISSPNLTQPVYEFIPRTYYFSEDYKKFAESNLGLNFVVNNTLNKKNLKFLNIRFSSDFLIEKESEGVVNSELEWDLKLSNGIKTDISSISTIQSNLNNLTSSVNDLQNNLNLWTKVTSQRVLDDSDPQNIIYQDELITYNNLPLRLDLSFINSAPTVNNNDNFNLGWEINPNDNAKASLTFNDKRLLDEDEIPDIVNQVITSIPDPIQIINVNVTENNTNLDYNFNSEFNVSDEYQIITSESLGSFFNIGDTHNITTFAERNIYNDGTVKPSQMTLNSDEMIFNITIRITGNVVTQTNPLIIAAIIPAAAENTRKKITFKINSLYNVSPFKLWLLVEGYDTTSAVPNSYNQITNELILTGARYISEIPARDFARWEQTTWNNNITADGNIIPGQSIFSNGVISFVSDGTHWQLISNTINLY